jgi:hypothetical protein
MATWQFRFRLRGSAAHASEAVISQSTGRVRVRVPYRAKPSIGQWLEARGAERCGAGLDAGRDEGRGG